jgi:triacylglycerol lipase
MFEAGFDVRWLIALVVALLIVAFVAWRAWRTQQASPRLRGPEEAPPVPVELGEDGKQLVPRTGAPSIVRGLPPPTKHPIVLAHGYFGFDVIPIPRYRREYFRGVREALTALGYEVHALRVAPVASVAFRASQLKQQIDGMTAPRVNIIAHSMGGLDARYAIARLGLDSRVASLTTIGTPHHGTPLADRSTILLGDWARVRRILASLGTNVDGLYDLTTRRMEEFNRLVLDSPQVAYSSVIGFVNAETPIVNALLAPGHAYLARIAGPNDGIVPADSQRWGKVLGEVFADHWAQVGWSPGFDVRAFYVNLAEQLAELGH